MLVYGDATRWVDPHEERRALIEDARRASALPLGLPRHEGIISLFIDASELAQGLADATFEALGGVDELSPGAAVMADLLTELARVIDRSWSSGFEQQDFDIEPSLGALAGLTLPDRVACKRAEGYAFYALYPEAFLQASKDLPQDRPIRIVGIRSIGLGLAALVAAGAGAPRPLSVRPVGHPFARELSLGPRLGAALGDGDARYAVADEGPGLSGSSFAAMLNALEGRGVDANRIDLFPSHAGDPGSQASPDALRRWRAARRHVVEFEDLILENPDPRLRLQGWAADIAGPPVLPLTDLSGGAWRALRYADEADWPAANVSQERRKFLHRSRSGEWLLKFNGLGRTGAEKLARGRALSDAGYTPSLAGACHGFLLERWLGDARPLRSAGLSRNALVARLGDYFSFRARHFPAPADAGASLRELATMLRRNGELSDAAPPADLLRFCDALARVETPFRRIVTDNRLHAQEWLALPDGRLLKADALDHAAAHDLVGCQDVAWDIAGATVEFDLDEAETEALAERVGRAADHPVDRGLVQGLLPCYLAFQLGAASLAQDGLGGLPREAARLEAEVTRYRERLTQALGTLL